ncbi:MAG TPA: CARDB domain-containing protein [Thermoplasmata archaeon]|nr:CARDB domain-containing protein [Thermoplasmata archaeon]
MRPFAAAAATLLIGAAALSLLGSPVRGATDDQNLTGLVYLADGTPLSTTPWADNTSFAVWVNHSGNWSTAWRYPAAPLWYLTSGGAHSVVLPAAEKDVSWTEGDPYRLEFDVSVITGIPGGTENATSHGTGDPGEFPPYGMTDNAIVWTPTDNWQRWDVVLLALPDLAVLPGDVTATPGTVQPGEPVSFSATVRNLGTRFADAAVAMFDDADADRFPDPAEIFDQPPVSLAPRDATSFARVWIAAGMGTHDLCAFADSVGALPESDEGNNVDCASVGVQPPQETRADYAPIMPQPPPPIRSGLSASASFSLEIRNDGNASGAGTATLAFFNETDPVAPFAAFPVPPLAPSDTSARFAAPWTSPATPGTVRVVADVDYAGDLLEWDEGNNRFTWTVDVIAGPVTNLVVGTPNVTAAQTFVTSSTVLSFTVLDQSGVGIRNTTYRVDGPPWLNYTSTGPFMLAGEGAHTVEWFSEDYSGNAEATMIATLWVDNTPPATAPVVGNPKHVSAQTFITSSTPISLAASDGGATPVGVAVTQYRSDGGPWVDHTTPFGLAGEGTRLVEYRSVDLLGTEETILLLTLIVDDTPPSPELNIGTPRYGGADEYVTSATPLTLTATDGGPVPVGIASIEYRLTASWTPYAGAFSLAGPDGPRTVEYRATDLLGNAFASDRELVLDNTPPATSPSRGDGEYPAGTTFAFTATDGGSGVSRTEILVDGGAWMTYDAPLTLAPGVHTIGFRSVDNLNNTEAERTLFVTIGEAPQPSPETNWKPLVAAVFASILALAGAWSARRASMAAGSRPGLRAFASTSLPFVTLEGGTGVISYLTGLLAIPPVFGAGTVVDVGILLAGITVSAYRVRRRTPPA